MSSFFTIGCLSTKPKSAVFVDKIIMMMTVWSDKCDDVFGELKLNDTFTWACFSLSCLVSNSRLLL